MELNDLLRRAVDSGASDIHLKLDRPPMLRRDGSVAPLEGAEPLTEADLDSYLRAVTAVAPQRYDLYHESEPPRRRRERASGGGRIRTSVG